MHIFIKKKNRNLAITCTFIIIRHLLVFIFPDRYNRFLTDGLTKEKEGTEEKRVEKMESVRIER